MKFVITDTCCLLMLMPINPNMLKEEKFKCKVNAKIIKEFRGGRFNKRFPDKSKYFKYLNKPLNIDKKKIEEYIKIITATALEFAEKKGNDKIRHLSYTDKNVIALGLYENLDIGPNDTVYIATEDVSLETLSKEEFEIKVIQSLYILNYWLENKLIEWDDDKHRLLQNWKRERQQPQSEIKKFEELTGYCY